MPVVVGVLAETAANETRVALIPEIATKLKALGVRVLIERGAGMAHGRRSIHRVQVSQMPAAMKNAASAAIGRTLAALRACKTGDQSPVFLLRFRSFSVR